MAKKKVVKRKKVKVPDRDEEVEIEVEEEVDDDAGLIGHPIVNDPHTTPATPQVDEVAKRLSVTEQHEQNEAEAAKCPECQRMAPRHCARHKINLPV